MVNLYEVIFKLDREIVLTLNSFTNWISAMNAVKEQQERGLVFNIAEIFETQGGKQRYLVNKETFN